MPSIRNEKNDFTKLCNYYLWLLRCVVHLTVEWAGCHSPLHILYRYSVFTHSTTLESLKTCLLLSQVQPLNFKIYFWHQCCFKFFPFYFDLQRGTYQPHWWDLNQPHATALLSRGWIHVKGTDLTLYCQQSNPGKGQRSVTRKPLVSC